MSTSTIRAPGGGGGARSGEAAQISSPTSPRRPDGREDLGGGREPTGIVTPRIDPCTLCKRRAEKSPINRAALPDLRQRFHRTHSEVMGTPLSSARKLPVRPHPHQTRPPLTASKGSDFAGGRVESPRRARRRTRARGEESLDQAVLATPEGPDDVRSTGRSRGLSGRRRETSTSRRPPLFFGPRCRGRCPRWRPPAPWPRRIRVQRGHNAPVAASSDAVGRQKRHRVGMHETAGEFTRCCSPPRRLVGDSGQSRSVQVSASARRARRGPRLVPWQPRARSGSVHDLERGHPGETTRQELADIAQPVAPQRRDLARRGGDEVEPRHLDPSAAWRGNCPWISAQGGGLARTRPRRSAPRNSPAIHAQLRPGTATGNHEHPFLGVEGERPCDFGDGDARTVHAGSTGSTKLRYRALRGSSTPVRQAPLHERAAMAHQP